MVAKLPASRIWHCTSPSAAARSLWKASTQTGTIAPGAFDLDGAKNAIQSCATRGELEAVKAQLRKAPKAALPELAELIKAQDAALPATDEEPADA